VLLLLRNRSEETVAAHVALDIAADCVAVLVLVLAVVVVAVAVEVEVAAGDSLVSFLSLAVSLEESRVIV